MSNLKITELERHATLNGAFQLRYKHASQMTGTEMTFSMFKPRMATYQKCPVLWWLSGLTCNDQVPMNKLHFQKKADDLGLILVFPDSSPRGANIPGETDAWDLGVAASYYVDATAAPWSAHYKMYSYITRELPQVLEANFEFMDMSRQSITGHSVGGHGALTIGLKNPTHFQSISAFAPVSNPCETPWGIKAFSTFLETKDEWAAYDAVELLKGQPSSKPLKVDVGLADEFYAKELGIAGLKSVKPAGMDLQEHQGFGHGFPFINSFVEDHLDFHAQYLRNPQNVDYTSKIDDSLAGQPIECQAAVSFGPKQKLQTETVVVAPPQTGEVRIKVLCNALCHTDCYTLDGQDPEGLFPVIAGHEAVGVVESVGPEVTEVKKGDLVIPCYTPQCSKVSCKFCMSSKTNLCPEIRATQGKGVMPDGTSRFTLKRTGETINHFMGCSTFSEYTVLAAISVAKIDSRANPLTSCFLGCGVATGLGAVWNTVKMEPNASVAVFGLGAVGLSVVQGAKKAGASKIIGVDLNPKKFRIAKKVGCTDCIDVSQIPAKDQLAQAFPWGIDYTFDCTGNTGVMRSALEIAHRGYGVSCVVGVAEAGKELSTRPFQLVTGRKWVGTAFGGFKSRAAVPELVQQTIEGTLNISEYLTHKFQGIDSYNAAIEALHSGDCLRAVVTYDETL